MTDISNQKRMAAQLLKCGNHRVFIDPDAMEDVAEAVTRQDVRALIRDGAIKKKQVRGISSGRAKKLRAQKAKRKRRGHGSRKGHRYSRTPKKREWIRTIRPLREELRQMRQEGRITPTVYRVYYRKAKGGLYRSRAHLRSQMESDGAFGKTAGPGREGGGEAAS